MPTEARTEDEKAPVAAAFKAATVNRGWPGGLAALASRRRYNMLAVTGEFSRKPSPVTREHPCREHAGNTRGRFQRH